MSIRLSEKHGLNPAIPLCYFCGEAKNELILAGRMKGDQEAPRAAVWDRNPCGKCRELMNQGIIFISVRDTEKEGTANPYRTGGFAVITEEAMRRFVQPPEMADKVAKWRVCFISNKTWRELGFPHADKLAD